MPKNLIAVISGPTGAGKTTVAQALLKKFPRAARVITATTREPRASEQPGVDYHFMAKHDFEAQIKQGEFLEYTYIKNRDTYYGTKTRDLKNLLKKHPLVLYVPDHIGLLAIKKHFPNNHLSIFLMYEQPQDIINRLTKRQPEITRAELAKRLKNAEDEAKHANLYDQVIINRENRLEQTITAAADLISRALLDKKG